MPTDEGFAILLRAVESAVERRTTDAMQARPRFVAGVGDVARAMQRATDAANAELSALGLNGYECERVLTAILCGLIPPPYPLDDL
jgi:hypothetical protein